MSQPNIANCYEEIVEDPSLLWLFPEKEWTSLQELPLLGTLQFRLREAFCPHSTPDMWRKARVEFIIHNGWKISEEATPMAILITDGVGEGNLGMMTTFCHHDQAKMEVCNVLSALHQHDFPKPSMVVVRRYTNTPYIPQGTSHFLYSDVSTLSGGASYTQFPLDQLCIHRQLPFSETEVVLPQEEGEVGLKVFPHSWEVPWQNSEEEHHFSDPVLLLVPSSTLLPHQEKGTQAEKESGFHQPSSSYKISIKPGFSWNVSWARTHKSWPKDMTIVGSHWLGNMRGSEQRWPKRQMQPFKKSFLWHAWLIWSSYCLGVSPLQFPFTIWVKHWPLSCKRMTLSQLPPLHLSWRDYQLWAPQAVQLIQLELCLL